MKNKISLRKLILSGLFLALGMVLPLFTAQIKEVGDTLLPMHFPILLCGLVCGPLLGGCAGLMLPFFRSLLFGMPPLYPNALWMALELMTYGLVSGWLYRKIKGNEWRRFYGSLGVAMVAGRLVWGGAKAILLGVSGKAFPFSAFLIGGFIDGLPGILLQLTAIPFLSKILIKEKDV